MARAGFKDHPKFKRLVFLLKEPIPHVWGYMECLWEVSYQRRCDQIGDAVDVELNAMFPGESGKLVAALTDPGVHLLDCVEGIYYIHDLADWAPPYVKASKKFRLLNPTDERSSNAKSTNSRLIVDECATISHGMRDQNGAESHSELQSALQREEGIEEGREKREEGEGEVSAPPETAALALARKQNAKALAERFVQKQAGGKEPVAKVAEIIEAKLTAGYNDADFAQEIDKHPDKRDYSERFYNVDDRLKKSKRQQAKTPEDVKSANKQRARELVEKQAAKSVKV